MKAFFSLILLPSLTLPCAAACNLDDAIGYTLVSKRKVMAFVENDRREDTFSGCKLGRILVFDDNTGVRCTGYTYHYAIRPTAYIFTSSYSLKLCIDGYWFNATRIH